MAYQPVVVYVLMFVIETAVLSITSMRIGRVIARKMTSQTAIARFFPERGAAGTPENTEIFHEIPFWPGKMIDST